MASFYWAISIIGVFLIQYQQLLVSFGTEFSSCLLASSILKFYYRCGVSIYYYLISRPRRQTQLCDELYNTWLCYLHYLLKIGLSFHRKHDRLPSFSDGHSIQL